MLSLWSMYFAYARQKYLFSFPILYWKDSSFVHFSSACNNETQAPWRDVTSVTFVLILIYLVAYVSLNPRSTLTSSWFCPCFFFQKFCSLEKLDSLVSTELKLQLQSSVSYLVTLVLHFSSLLRVDKSRSQLSFQDTCLGSSACCMWRQFESKDSLMSSHWIEKSWAKCSN